MCARVVLPEMVLSKVQHVRFGKSRHLIGQLAPRHAEPRLLVQVEHEKVLVSIALCGARLPSSGERQAMWGYFLLRASGFARETRQVLQLLAQRERERAEKRRFCLQLVLGKKIVGRLGVQLRICTVNLLPHDVSRSRGLTCSIRSNTNLPAPRGVGWW